MDKYFKYIYKAEDALLENNFSKGSLYFEKAFSSGDGVVFLKDVHNAILASIVWVNLLYCRREYHQE